MRMIERSIDVQGNVGEAMGLNSEDHDRAQRGHFYGYGDPDHTPSILQTITSQRYKGTVAKKVVDIVDERNAILRTLVSVHPSTKH